MKLNISTVWKKREKTTKREEVDTNLRENLGNVEVPFFLFPPKGAVLFTIAIMYYKEYGDIFE